MGDLWNECFTLEAQMTPQQFETTFCQICRNGICDRSAANGVQWLKRILTQQERLLDNPHFADPNDPSFASIRERDFPSTLKEAMRLEISERKGDWSVPTEIETNAYALEMMGIVSPAPSEPKGFQAPEIEVKDEDRIIRRMTVQGSTKGSSYTVTLWNLEGKETWSCTCKAFEHGRANPCKHIQAVMSNAPEESEEPKPEDSKPSGPVVTPPRFQNAKQMPLPKMSNIPMPTGGLMVDGSKPPSPNRVVEPKADPWAATPTVAKVVPVGGKIKMGGD
jgi:hypothetical protein